MIGAILVDGGNLSFSFQRHGQKSISPDRIDYGRVAPCLRQRIHAATGENVHFNFLCYYSGYRDQADLDRRRPFSTMLKMKGWTHFDIPAKYIAAERYWKDDQVDLTLALDAYDLILRDQVQCLVLMSHDSDFSALFRRIPGKVLKYVAGFKGEMSAELTALAEPMFLDDFWKEIEYGKA